MDEQNTDRAQIVTRALSAHVTWQGYEGEEPWSNIEKINNASEVGNPTTGDLVSREAVADAIEDDKGRWVTCSGCYDTEDGHPTQRYSYSDVLQCALGNGCFECGGIGAIWDTTDYAELAEWMESELREANAVPAPTYVQTIQTKLNRFHECADDGEDVDIGRLWLDTLTTLGLLERLPSRPAAWSLTDAGMAVLEGGEG